MLKSLRATTASSRSSVDFWSAVLEAFDINTYDTPFAAIYEIKENNENEAVLQGTRGIPSRHPIVPAMIVMAEYDGVFGDDIREARRKGKRIRRDNLSRHDGMLGVDRRGFKLPCSTAVVIPIVSTGPSPRTEAFVILGVNPKRPLDSDYEIWFDQIQVTISEYLAGVRIVETAVEEGMRTQLEGDYPRAPKFGFGL